MTDVEIIEAANEVFVDSFEIPREKLVPQAQIFADLGLDSLDVVDLVVSIQKKFGIRVRNDERIRSVRTMQDLYSLLLSIKREQEAAGQLPSPGGSAQG